MKKILFIIPYFGKLNNYFQLFLDSCKNNENYNWLIITNDRTKFSFPKNVEVIYDEFNNFQKKVQQKFDKIKISLESPYKLCDFKPTYGYVFEEYIKDYQYWGYCDIDLIFGSIDNCLKLDKLTQYDKIGILGHFTIFKNTKELREFYIIVKDLINNPTVLQMKNYRQHYDTSCYDHCIEVAYWSYLFCKKFNLDYKAAARAGILHDLFLYDWRHSYKDLNGWHAFEHPKIALKNAKKICDLTEKEQDIILKHMWPVTFFQFPKYKESFVITITDKMSALKSFHEYCSSHLCQKKFLRYAYIFFAFTIFKFNI